MVSAFAPRLERQSAGPCRLAVLAPRPRAGGGGVIAAGASLTWRRGSSIRRAAGAPLIQWQWTGLLALRLGEPGQVRKEAATAVNRKCRGSGSSTEFLGRLLPGAPTSGPDPPGPPFLAAAFFQAG